MKARAWAVAVWAARIALAALFFYAGFIKLGTSEQFAVTVAQFTILPPALAAPFALALGWVETIAAVLLVIPRTARFGATIVAGLLVVFIAALGYALAQGLVVSCGCFGEEVAPSRAGMWAALGRDVLLLALTLGLARRRVAPPRRARA